MKRHEMTAEGVLRDYIVFDDVNSSDMVLMLPLTICDAMEVYAELRVKRFIVAALSRKLPEQ